MRIPSNLRSLLIIYLVGLLLCLGLRLALWVTYPDSFAGITILEGLRTLWVGARFDLAVLTQLNALILLALLVPFRFAAHPLWRQGWMLLAILPLLLVLVLGIASIAFYGEVQRHLGAELLFMVNDWPFVVDLLVSSRREEFIALLMVSLLGGWAWWKLIRSDVMDGPAPRWPHAWLTLVLVLPLLVLLGRGLVLDGKTLNVVDAHALGDARLANLAMNAAFSVIHTSRNLDKVLKSPVSDSTEAALRKELNISQANPFVRQYGDQPTPHSSPNIVLIVLESWSNDYIDGLSGKDLGVTPNMDALLEQSQVYTNHYAAAQRSIQSLQAILTGVPVLPGQPRLSEGLEQVDMSRVGNLAAERGYESVFVQSSTRRSFRMNAVAASLGFSEYFGQEDIPLVMDYPEPTPRFGWDHDTLQFFHQRLDRMASKGPFMGVVFTGTTHEPFADPGKQFHRFPHDSASENGYLNTLAYSDWALGEFMAKARASDWYDDTVFLITSDHVLRASAGSLRSRFHVPLVVYAPKLISAHRSDKLVSHYDILPTVVDLMGSTEPFVAFGESIFRDALPDEAWVNQGEMVGLLRTNSELEFTPARLAVSFSAESTAARSLAPDQYSLELRAALLTHLVIDKLNLNNWTRGLDR
ncbi:LTA synthase family protein [Halopseudomonas salina]|uniref:Alkaline phosphatase n=1 Tax=Halopseudomonas salina TaxID=1323744 RepID=A0ABQ1PN87_9GAMM|nr:LTA synthase family protein [Halopseudomonas salina]GGC99997.1 alkaline phosphatase [Halopseudomonas salina]